MSKLHQLLKACVPTTIRRSLKSRLKRRLGAAAVSKPAVLPPADFRGLIDDPLSALARGNGSPVIIEVPLSRCRTFQELGFLATADSANPFLMTVQWAQAEGHDTYAKSPLKQYYDTVQLATGADKLGLDNPKLRSYSPLHVDAPWRNSPGEAVYERRARTVRREAEAYGSDLTIKDGWRVYGPMTDSMGKFEFQRLLSVFSSIAANGYELVDFRSYPTGNLMLTEDQEWAVWIDDGNHRVSVLSILHYEKTPIVLNPLNTIRWSDAESWPAVQQGAMTAEEARQVFERIFSGRQPDAVAAVWPPAEASS